MEPYLGLGLGLAKGESGAEHKPSRKLLNSGTVTENPKDMPCSCGQTPTDKRIVG